jgi:hypothetical protein
MTRNSWSEPISKIARGKWTGGMAQVVQHLPIKGEALNSKPKTSEKTK